MTTAPAFAILADTCEQAPLAKGWPQCRPRAGRRRGMPFLRHGDGTRQPRDAGQPVTGHEIDAGTICMRPVPEQPQDGSATLANPRHERFATLYAGECFGNGADAYRKAGFNAKGAGVDRANGSRLLATAGVLARVRYLRRQAEAMIACDRATLLQLHSDIMLNPDADNRDRIQAAQEFARLQGYYSPDKQAVTYAGAVEHHWTVKDIREPDK